VIIWENSPGINCNRENPEKGEGLQKTKCTLGESGRRARGKTELGVHMTVKKKNTTKEVVSEKKARRKNTPGKRYGKKRNIITRAVV